MAPTGWDYFDEPDTESVGAGEYESVGADESFDRCQTVGADGNHKDPCLEDQEETPPPHRRPLAGDGLAGEAKIPRDPRVGKRSVADVVRDGREREREQAPTSSSPPPSASGLTEGDDHLAARRADRSRKAVCKTDTLFAVEPDLTRAEMKCKGTCNGPRGDWLDEKPPSYLGGTAISYCEPCYRAYEKERYQRKKARQERHRKSA